MCSLMSIRLSLMDLSRDFMTLIMNVIIGADFKINNQLKVGQRR